VAAHHVEELPEDVALLVLASAQNENTFLGPADNDCQADQVDNPSSGPLDVEVDVTGL